jgi:hypothetical protein
MALSWQDDGSGNDIADSEYGQYKVTTGSNPVREIIYLGGRIIGESTSRDVAKTMADGHFDLGGNWPPPGHPTMTP